MRKLIIAALLAGATAFSAGAEFRWGPTAGVNISRYYWKQDLVGNKHLCGPTAGLMGEVMIPGIGFGIDFGLLYQMVGGQVDFGRQVIWSSEGVENLNVWNHELEIPINLRFKWTRMDGFEQYLAPFAYVGPVFNFTLASTKTPVLERPTGWVAIQCGIGAEVFEHWQVSVGYSWGVSYIQRTVKLDNFSSRSQGWQINVAYLF